MQMSVIDYLSTLSAGNEMSAEFYAISFVILVVLAHWAIRRIGDWLYPDLMGAGRESRQADLWRPLTSSSLGAHSR